MSKQQTERGRVVNEREITVDTGPVFEENWYNWRSLNSLTHKVALTRLVPGAIIEVGCWEGKSTIHLANCAAPEAVFAVDTWQGNLSEGESHPTVHEIRHHGRDVYQRFRQNVAVSTVGNVIPARMGWEEFFRDYVGSVALRRVSAESVEEFRLEKIRLLHIDGDHSYEQVKGNILAALPHMAPGGVICGDDWGTPGVNQAATECLPGVQYDGLWWWRKTS